ncbi:nucleotidyltransferase domain-containing protein [Candidatus Symbiothrix dinenymphae]|uniref:nucleotidyltransferase domain-containing protein n=1 Tax=Candidatus Symbiothrix dinenymphae TaxID=467085 RepID=UPI0006C58EB0|nr:nucleotidyltransferase domain-containing protein [Candidatus Symbiothrix dinenymphae]GAP72516.1 DNA polymerase, beta domain protein region [Candidatus Symbiothrix dinenymphae]
MDKTNALKIVQEYADAVRTHFDYSKVILFGSYAKGNFHEDSDIDVAVVFADYDNRMERQLELMNLTHKIDSRIEPHPFRENEFEISNPFVNEIIKYGQEIVLA